MSEPTIDDLRIVVSLEEGPHSFITTRPVAPDEFDRIARSEGYVKLDEHDVERVRQALEVLMDGEWMRMANDENEHLFPPAIAAMTVFALNNLLAALGEEE